MSGGPRRNARELLAESGELTPDTIAVEVGGAIVDLHTPIEDDAVMRRIERRDPEALAVIRHSTAHVMADAVQRLFPGTKVTIGPAIKNGFYYDFDKADGPFTDRDLLRIEKEVRKLIKQKLPFERRVVSRDDARRMFDDMGETYKLELIDGIAEDVEISVYTHGKPGPSSGGWTDLCSGPHVPNTADLGVVKLTSVAGAYWRGDENRPMLQRIYGTAFLTTEQLEEHLRLIEEARARDHRKLGRELELFMFHDYAPAMPFFLPKGAFVYNRLIDFIRGLYVDYGYEEVITPQIFDPRLFATSGHLENYRENMYLPVTADQLAAAHGHVDSSDAVDGQGGAVDGGRSLSGELDTLTQKPMNCPSHCLIFGQRKRSYRELPWRVADFGRLHRYERGGVVHGLARVRSFCQDDAHIFCTPEQMRTEIEAFNQLLFEVYSAFEFRDLSVKLALRPDKRVGSDEDWDKAESSLEEVLVASGLSFEKLVGEGAFYGPKLEFHVVDALDRSWQLGTIQVDYALPERFDLSYVTPQGDTARPVMLHRAILGSIERFFGMYIEHCAGKFPVWLSPEQATLVTVSEKQAEYGVRAQALLRGLGLRVGLDNGADKLGAKIRRARNARVPYIGVIGEQEAASDTITPRSREEGDLPTLSLEEFGSRLLTEAKVPRLERTPRS